MRLNDLLYEAIEPALMLQGADGSFPAGRNGPYANPETPVRNSAHWLIMLLYAHELSGGSACQAAARRAAEYLMQPHHRPMGATFLCRKGPERNLCNGLIGQAWVIEALATAAARLHEPRYAAVARELFLLHPFDTEAGLWRYVNVDGSHGTFDMTFNHQLWFAASGALADSNPRSAIGARVLRFLDQTLASHLKLDPSGRIFHFVPSPQRRGSSRQLLAQVLRPLRHLRREPHMVRREIGHHAFNLYAFALLQRQFPHHPLWESEKLAAALQFVQTPEYIAGLEDNIYGFPYNLPGFEVAFAMQTFTTAFLERELSDSWWVSLQFQRAYDPHTRLLTRRTQDRHTLAARLYEATRLRDVEVVLAGVASRQI
jgi:hypothetical protein